MGYLIFLSLSNVAIILAVWSIPKRIKLPKANNEEEVSKIKFYIEEKTHELSYRTDVINNWNEVQFAAVQGINKRLDAIKPEKKEWDELDQQRKKLNAEIKAFESKNQYLNVKGFIEHCDAVIKENMSAKGKLPTVNGPSHYEIQIEMYESAKEAVRKYAGRKVYFQEDF